MTILLLAGTAEARHLSFALNHLEPIASLAGMTQRPNSLGGTLRVGGFGGVDGLSKFIFDCDIHLVIDATHPFAATMSRHAFEACARTKARLLQVVRPPWTIDPSWHTVADLTEAAGAIEPGKHVFLSTGRSSMDHFAHRDDVRFTIRVLEEGGVPPFSNGQFLVSQPPFTRDDEIATFLDLGIETLVTRNSGGAAGMEKLEAAAYLGLDVIMVDRPKFPQAKQVNSVEAALQFLKDAQWLVE